MSTQHTGERGSRTRFARRKVAAITAGVIRLWNSRTSVRSSSGSDPAVEQQLEMLAARVEHLEAQLEGLQDAVYREAVRGQEDIGELRRRTEPEQLASQLAKDARRRGL